MSVGARSAGPSAAIRPSGMALACLACLALAVLSWALLPTVPSYDPYSWIIWGREVSDPHLAFAVFDGPSWKPLPFAFTVVWGLFGGAAPTLWMITARAAGLLGLLAAGRLAARLAGPGRWGAVAGLVAAAGIVLTYDWPYDFLRGTSEPGLVAATLWSIERLIAGRGRAAFWLWVAVALLRPESWPLLVVLAGWLALGAPGASGASAGSRGSRAVEGPGAPGPLGRPAGRGAGLRVFGSARGRLELLAGLLLVPLGWFGPPWLGSGAPLLAAHNAALYDGVLGANPFWTEIGRFVGEQTWPLLPAALAGVVAGVVRGRDRRVLLGLAAGVLAWWGIVLVMTLALGYPGLERFSLPAAAVVCVLGGVGVVAIARALRPARSGGGVLAGAVCVVLLALAALGSLRPIGVLGRFEPEAALAVHTVRGLDAAVRAAGGRDAVLPCGRSFVAVNHAAQPALAWELRVGLPSVGTAMSRPGLDFVGPANRATGIPAAIAGDLVHERLVARSGPWHVYRLTRRARPRGARCLGH